MIETAFVWYLEFREMLDCKLSFQGMPQRYDKALRKWLDDWLVDYLKWELETIYGPENSIKPIGIANAMDTWKPSKNDIIRGGLQVQAHAPDILRMAVPLSLAREKGR